ncbi:hypothetical protein [Sporosarcina sp. FSL K6-2383]|uniref:hypothetical protein n=1 Tax=Sporosarcina sp. FSL K6-2383 TaxID=2921556 RepID=UPI00315A76FA
MFEKSLGDLLSEQQQEELKRLESLPKPIKYVSDECVKCGRVRVELYDNGHLICEKCNWSHTTNEYSTHREFI